MTPRDRRLPSAILVSALGFACLDAPTGPPPDRERDVTNGLGSSAINVAALAPGDELRIEFRSDGCFHHVRFTLRLQRDSLGARILVDGLEGNLAPGWHFDSEARIDLKALDRLDNLLHFYRTNHLSGCTTVDSVAVMVRRSSAVTRESFVDGSCGTYEDERLLRIPTLFPAVRDSQ